MIAAGWLPKLLVQWVQIVAKAPRLTLLLAALATAAGLYHTSQNLTMNTDTSAMVDSRLPYRVAWDEFRRVFPQDFGSILIAVEGESPEAVEAVAAGLTARLGGVEQGIVAVERLNGGAFFQQNGALLLPLPVFEDMIDGLSRAQPLLAQLAQKQRLPALLEMIQQSVDYGGGQLPPQLGDLVAAVADRLAAETPSALPPLSWQSFLSAGPMAEQGRRQLIQLTPDYDYASLHPAGLARDALKMAIAELPPELAQGTQIWVTGQPALADEELESAGQGAGLAAILSLVVVAGLLVWCFRSSWMALIAFLTLIVGLAWTAAFAAIFIGELNLISVTFAVLFVGLGVDFAIHFGLRFRETLNLIGNRHAALAEAARHSGPALLLCAAAAAIAFASFIPTSYRGLAELGAIAGAGMFLAFAATLTLMPAFLAWRSPKSAAPVAAIAGRSLEAGIRARARPIAILASIAALGSAALMPMLDFDENTINLKDPNQPSVLALQHLATADRGFSYPVEILAPSLAEAGEIAEAARQLPEIYRVLSIQSFLPADQEEKLGQLFDLSFLYLPILDLPPPAAFDGPAARATMAAFAQRFAASPSPELARLAAALQAAAKAEDSALQALDHSLFANFPTLMARIDSLLAAAPIALETLPAGLKARWLAADGQARVQIVSAADVIGDPAALESFVDRARSLNPQATGASVVMVEGGRAVSASIIEATIIGLVALTLLLAIVLRRLSDIALVLIPVALAGLLTCASAVLLSIELNFANVIALPLLFGLGLAAGTHLVLRAREDGAGTRGTPALFATSTPRATIFSALTTVASFASLTFASHRGMQSMGLMLAIAIGWTLVATLVLLPALIELTARRRA